MFSSAFLFTLIAASLSGVSATIPTDTICPNKQVVAEALIGEANNVIVQHVNCGQDIQSRHIARGLEAPQATSDNVCGAPCSTNCFTPTGGGPVPAECQVIADALLYAGQNTGALFTIAPASANYTGIVLQYRSCEAFMINQSNETLTYCRDDFAGVVGYVANNCQSTQNAHGGNCVASDERWFVQVQHS